MKTLLSDYITKYEGRHKKRNRFIAGFLCLSLLTSFVVNRQLTNTGIAATADYICGQEEHTHDESCYQLSCGLEGETSVTDFANLYLDENLGTLSTANAFIAQNEENSSEGDELYSEDGESVQASETPVHVHDASCYTLICDKVAHVHSPECIAPEATENPSSDSEASAVSEDGEEETLEIKDGASQVENNAASDTQSLNDVYKSFSVSLLTKDGDNGDWKKLENNSVKEGNWVKATIEYSVDRTKVTKDKPKVTYQIPANLTIAEAQSGYISGTVGSKTYNGTSEDDSWGTYTIDANGLITLTFNDKFFATDEEFKGGVTFQGRASVSESGSSSNLKFDLDNTNYTITPSGSKTDLTLTKTASAVTNGKITYTVTATSKSGTVDGVKIKDTVTVNGIKDPTLSSVTVTKNGSSVTPTSYTTSSNTSGTNTKLNYEMTLPNLGKGETYTLTYTVDVSGSKISSNGYAAVGNSVEGYDGNSYKDKQSTNTKIQGKMLEKKGNANGTKITWTITVNGGKNTGVAGDWYLSDYLDGTSLDLTKATDLKVTDTTTNQDITQTFINNGNNKLSVEDGHSYTIVYTTDGKFDSDNNAIASTNTVKVKDYEASGTVTPVPKTEFVGKNVVGSVTSVSSSIKQQQWMLTLNTTEGSNASIVITDKLTDNDGNLDDSIHWTTLSLLKSGLGTNSEYTYSIKGYDANGNQVYNDDSKIVSFELTLTPTSTWSGSTISPTYSSQFCVDSIGEGETITVRNKATDNGVTRESSTSWTKSLSFGKFVWGDKDAYNKDWLSANYTANYDKINNTLTYRIWVVPSDDSDMTITDTLPEGMTVKASDVVVAMSEKYNNRSEYNFTSKDSYDLTQDKWKPTVTVDDQVVTVKIPGNGRPTNLLNGSYGYVIEYTVSIEDDEDWENQTTYQKEYTNVVSYNGKTTSQTTEVERDLPNLAKTGEQVTVYNSTTKKWQTTNNVQYWVTINPMGKTLNDGDPITLTDTLTTPDGVKVSIDLTKVKLYTYKANNSSNHCIGTELDIEEFTSTYDESTKTFTVTIPDGLACVLTYTYTVDDLDNKNSASFINKAHLTGGSGSDASESITVKEASSSAYVSKENKLRIIKVDADRYQKTLEGAQFDIYKVTSDGTETKVNSSPYETGSDGTIEIDFKTLDKDTLYYAVETKAPDGYVLDETKHYFFVPLNADTTVDSWYNSNSSWLTSQGIAKDDIQFVQDGGYATLYVPNTSKSLTVKKLWFDYDGSEISGSKDIQVTLYQGTRQLEYKTVTVCYADSNYNAYSGNDKSLEYQVKPGSDFTFVFGQNQAGGLYGIKVGNGNTITSFTKDSSGNKVADCGTISEDTTIYVYFSAGQGNTWTPGTSLFANCIYTPAKYVLADSTVYDTVTLNASNGYKYTWDDIPTTDEDGNPVYYTAVESTDLGSNWVTTYLNNTGVQTGVITINNKRLTKSVPYSLPKTGGSGTYMYYIGGACLMASSLMVINFKRRKRRARMH